jgi:hypothetical protein
MGGVEFFTVPASGTPIPGAVGMLDVTLNVPPPLRGVPKVVRFVVKDTHASDEDSAPVEHFGSAMATSRGMTVVAPLRSAERSASDTPGPRRFR